VKVRYRPRALADIDEIFQYLNERSPAGARCVLGAIADAIDEIGANPRS
jgi:plasmid stabilization system protein ParE